MIYDSAGARSGRRSLFRTPLLVLALPAWWTLSLLASEPPWIFLDYVNLAFHEAGHLAFRRGGGLRMRTLGVATALAALIQVLLGFVSVYTRLSVVPVSLHTLLAATLLTLLSAMATLTWAPPPEPRSSFP